MSITNIFSPELEMVSVEAVRIAVCGIVCSAV